MIKVLDAHGLLVFLEKEAGFEKIEEAFVEAAKKDIPLLMASVNYGEVYYIVLRECGAKKASGIEDLIKTLPIEIVNVDILLAREAGRLKAGYKMFYADCFAAALAKLRKAEVLTGDKEFKAIEHKVKIAWIR